MWKGDYCSMLLADLAGSILATMARDRTQQPTPYPFSTASLGARPPAATTKRGSSAQEQRNALPKGLPNAVKHLNDQELDLLIAVPLEEARRRGRSRPSVPSNAPDEFPLKQLSRTDKSSLSLASGNGLVDPWVNAVRAAFKAGIKPSVISRQFGISQSDVRKVLAPDALGRPID